jgi:acetyl esterase/lipase
VWLPLALAAGPDDTPAPPAAAKAARRANRGYGDLKPDHADVSYGPHKNNRLDLWLAKSDRPAPLAVFIHGGGFVGGDKSNLNAAVVRQYLAAGVSVAAVNYRFRSEAPINVVLRDSARAIQFLRSKANDYHLDKTRVVAFGGSAGAGTALWLAFHDDLADPHNADLVLRESTRLVAAASTAGQATYDIVRWEEVLGKEAMRFYPRDGWPALYGLKTLTDLESAEGKRLRADVDMLGLITRDDPPVFLAASDRFTALDSRGATNHTPKHSEAIKKRCDEVGVPAVLKVGDASTGEASPVAFLLKHLGARAGANPP